MAKRTILWTVLPWGRDDRGRLRVSLVASPRLTPEAADEQRLAAFPDVLDWPGTLAGLRLSAQIGPDEVGLEPVSAAEPALFKQVFDENTPVAGFVFKDMSRVALRSFPVRTVLGTLRRHYGRLAVQATGMHPTLLPWNGAHPDLKGMLTDLGTRTRTFNFGDRPIEVAEPGFSRFFGEEGDALEKRLGASVFGPDGIYRGQVAAPDAEEQGGPANAGTAPLRAMAPDWYDPRPGGPDAPLVARPDAAVMDQFKSAAEYALWQADRFYRREQPTDAERRMRRPDFAAVPPPPKVPEYDFHRILASLADYPALMRALGFVVDAVLEDDGPVAERIAAGGGTGQGRIRLVIEGGDGAVHQTPRTAWVADKDRFLARPRGQDLVRGLLRLEDASDMWGDPHVDKRSAFDVYQVDPDGAAVKTVGFTLTAQNLVGKSLSLRQPDGEITYTTGNRQPVAALRSGGLGVSQHGRAQRVAADTAAAALKNQRIDAGQGDTVTFFAEDLQRGFRVDVAPVRDAVEPGDWYSLCARVGTYTMLASGEAWEAAPDEGHVSGPSTSSQESAPDDHYLHESLFRWTGWSLCAPRPGLTLRAGKQAGTEIQTETPDTVTDTAVDGNRVRAEFRVKKGSLPKLRFGQLYRVRARVVDLAGNSLSLDDRSLDPLEQATDAVGYWRFEPIDPPAVVHRSRVSEGESLERLVIRSNFDADADAYPATPDFAAAAALPASADFEYGGVNERHFVPPKAAQQLCEQHGAFDPLWGDPHRIRDAYAIAAREEGTLYDSPPGAVVELVVPGALQDVATTAALPPALPSPEEPTGERLSGGQYVVHREAQCLTPYLPDPAAGGVALRAMPGHALPGVTGPAVLGDSCAVRIAPNGEPVILVAHGKDWPDSTGFRLILAERPAKLDDPPCAETFEDDGAPKWDEDARTLTLFVAKGRIVRLCHASFAHPAEVGRFGVPHWTATASERAFVTGMAETGAAWMLTPFRPLTLVHATQQPVCLPELIKMSIQRTPGADDARLLCRMVRLHGPSTGKIEVEAEWGEWVDDPARDAPERVLRRGQLGEVPLAENHPNTFDLGGAVAAAAAKPGATARGDVHALGDTRFRLVRYRLRGTTRFREYLPPALYDQRDKVTRLGPIALGQKLSTANETDPGAPLLPDAAGEAANHVVPASTPPAEPKALYVMPTFRWQESGTATSRTVTRLGNGLRVWLDRPWFSSGDGELLGVVLLGEGARFTDVPASMQALVTQWGFDPLWDTAPPANKVQATHFPTRVHVESAPLIERPGGAPALVVGHRVRWDTERKLWRADIEIEPGTTYMPFVRLALVRLQPHALPGSKVSKVVATEFSQLLPRRRAQFTRRGGTVSVALHGPAPESGPVKFPVDSEYRDISYVQGPHETGRNRVELVLQTRDAALDSDLAWRDGPVLASGEVGTSSGGTTPLPGGIVATPVATARRGVSFRTAAQTVSVTGAAGRLRPEVTQLLDPTIWSGTGTVPAGGAPARLMLREFERFYTDRTVPERRDGTVRQRRVIEERLVYAATFAL